MFFRHYVAVFYDFVVQATKQAIWQVDTLDVGQGLATLIVKNGKGILYDTGPAWQGGNMAELEILPYLQREGITLEKLILSHDDNDHAGGASTILKAYPNVEFITPSRKTMGKSPHFLYCWTSLELARATFSNTFAAFYCGASR